jgi:hypothetical protein
MTIKYFQMAQNIPKVHKNDQMAIKYTKIWISGLKKYHLAALVCVHRDGTSKP